MFSLSHLDPQKSSPTELENQQGLEYFTLFGTQFAITQWHNGSPGGILGNDPETQNF